MESSLIIPMAVHVAFTAALYVLLTVVRAPAVWGVGRGTHAAQRWAAIEPRISANLSNQFEWPVFFYAACLLLIVLHAVDTASIVLAWIFIGGRVLHGAVQILTGNIRLRGLVFTINFLAVLGLWVLLVPVALR